MIVHIDIQDWPESFIVKHDAALPFPFPPESFDVIVAAEVVEHIVDTGQFLDNCSKVLREGGCLVITTPNLLFWVNRLRMLMGRRPAFAYADFHVRMFVWEDLREKLAKRFEVVSLTGSHVLVGRRHGAYAEIFSVLGDYLPKLAAHFVVVCRKERRTLDA